MVMLWLWLAACGDRTTTPADPASATLLSDDTAASPTGATADTSSPSPTADTATSGSTLPPHASAGCTAGLRPSSPYDVSISSGGRTREAIVDLPATYDGTTPAPLVLNFHGAATTADMHRGYTDMHIAANARGWVSVHPQGTNRTWDYLSDSADIRFATELLDELEQVLCLDTRRVYATGLSNGGYFSYQLACDLGPRITAIAAVAGGDATLGCNPGVVVPLLHIHGTADLIVPYAGNLVLRSARQSVSGWADKVNACRDAPTPGFSAGDVSCEVWSCSPTDEAALCTVDGGGHTWPGAYPIPTLGPTNDDIDATASILDFFARWARP